MKSLYNFIIEKFKINSKSVSNKSYVNRQLVDNWNIKDAEDGDIVQWNSSELYFIYKCLNENRQYKATYEDSIVYHVAYDFNTKSLSLGPDTGVGHIEDNDEKNKRLYQLASIEKCEDLFDALEENGYYWDYKNKKLIKK